MTKLEERKLINKLERLGYKPEGSLYKKEYKQDVIITIILTENIDGYINATKEQKTLNYILQAHDIMDKDLKELRDYDKELVLLGEDK